MATDKGNTWYALPEGKDPAVFENWEQIDERRVIVMVPARSCAECHGKIKVEAWMEHKRITFLDALFDFEHAGIMVCPACWEQIGKGLPLPATAPNGGTRAVPRVGDAPVVSSDDATAATGGNPISGTSGNDPRRGTPRADARRGGKAGAAMTEKKPFARARDGCISRKSTSSSWSSTIKKEG